RSAHREHDVVEGEHRSHRWLSSTYSALAQLERDLHERRGRGRGRLHQLIVVAFGRKGAHVAVARERQHRRQQRCARGEEERSPPRCDLLPRTARLRIEFMHHCSIRNYVPPFRKSDPHEAKRRSRLSRGFARWSGTEAKEQSKRGKTDSAAHSSVLHVSTRGESDRRRRSEV